MAWSDAAGQASIESRQHHHAEMGRNAQIVSEQVRTRYHHIAKWVTGNPRAITTKPGCAPKLASASAGWIIFGRRRPLRWRKIVSLAFHAKRGGATGLQVW
jgi:hypothetical protein